MTSPNGTIEVICSGYEEIRMGAPRFGAVELRGSAFRPTGRNFGEAMAFGPDSRFLAISELVDASRPACRAVVFDFKRKVERIVHVHDPGLIKKVEWLSPTELRIQSWSLHGGDAQNTWHAPADDPNVEEKPWWQFW